MADTILHKDLPDGDLHPGHIKHSLATAENDFLVASGAGAFVKKTLAETQAILEKPKFLADKNGTSQINIPLDTGTKVTFTNEVFDVGSGYDAVNSKWVPGVIGNYRINCNLYLDTKGAGKYVALGIFKNGVNIQQSYDEGVFMASISRSVAIDNVADYIEIYVYQNAINNNSINGGVHLTSFSGYMLP